MVGSVNIHAYFVILHSSKPYPMLSWQQGQMYQILFYNQQSVKYGK